jgi:hypothetical protein
LLQTTKKELDYVHYKRFNRILAFNEKKKIILYLLYYLVLVFAQNKEENATKNK